MNSDNDFPGGWLYFAGTILGLAGLMRLVDAFWAFRYDGVLPDEFEGALLGTTLSTYGWAYIVVGVILILSSFAVLNRSQLARWIGIISGFILTVSAMWWMPIATTGSVTIWLMRCRMCPTSARRSTRTRMPH